MKDLGLIVTAIEDPRHMEEEERAAGLVFSNILRAEKLPDDPPISAEEFAANLKGIPSFMDVHIWHVRENPGGPLVAAANVGISHMGQNEHLAHFGIDVLPSHRRRGIARHLLGNIVATAGENGRTLLMSGSSGRVPAGAAFLERIGAARGLESHTNQLDLADLDRSLLREWQERATERASGFDLLWNDGPLPDDLIASACDLVNAVSNDVPLGDLQMESFQVTPEQVREMERGALLSGEEIWIVFARESATGTLAGVTMTFWNPHSPYKAGQGITGVLPAYRSLGLGRWIKAAMLERVVNERPSVRFVRTSNADSNAPMLGINHALGFKPYCSDISWQIPVERVATYLATEEEGQG